ncbi:hypothetical protein BN000_00095 [Mycobacterium europaeum]|uniref:Uncharacterized protein n=1 Tax=Mycobacterium europaeum TaxID=761804 RepID=A0A0U1CXG8_9MYCO|nr:hypothetical protein BN000_00095 [Mycobacterium europaeum]
MRWNQGRSKIDALIADGAIERVQPDRAAADQLLAEARLACACRMNIPNPM